MRAGPMRGRERGRGQYLELSGGIFANEGLDGVGVELVHLVHLVLGLLRQDHHADLASLQPKLPLSET